VYALNLFRRQFDKSAERGVTLVETAAGYEIAGISITGSGV